MATQPLDADSLAALEALEREEAEAEERWWQERRSESTVAEPGVENAAYGDQHYWERRYQLAALDSFEWYFGFDVLLRFGVLEPITAALRQLRGSSGGAAAVLRVLVVGCGDSELSHDLQRHDGQLQVDSIDISPTVVAKMARRHAEIPQLSYQTMDVCAMTFGDATYDLVIDKGTLDALSCSAQSFRVLRAMTDEISRVLVPGGVFLLLSYAPNRRPHLCRPGLRWRVTMTSLDTKSPPKGDGAEAAGEVAATTSGGKDTDATQQRWQEARDRDLGAADCYVYVCTNLQPGEELCGQDQLPAADASDEAALVESVVRQDAEDGGSGRVQVFENPAFKR